MTNEQRAEEAARERLTREQVEAYRSENHISMAPPMPAWAEEENRVLDALCDFYLHAKTAEANLAAAVAQERERILKLINHSEESAVLAEPGWETGYAAACRAMDAQVRALAPSAWVMVPRDNACKAIRAIRGGTGEPSEYRWCSPCWKLLADNDPCAKSAAAGEKG